MTRTFADLLIEGAVHTLKGGGLGTAAGLAIGGGVVLGAGPLHELTPFVGPGTRRWRLGPELCVVPGITDAHLHLRTAAMAALGLRLGLRVTSDDGFEPAFREAMAARRTAVIHCVLDPAWVSVDEHP